MYIRNCFLLIIAITNLSLNTYAFNFDKSRHTIQFGGASNTGNSETTNITASLSNELKYKLWTFNSGLDGQLATSKGEESARSLKGNAELNRKLSLKAFAFAKGSMFYDKYGTYDFITRESVGLGHILFENLHHKLSIQTGPGFLHRRIAGTNDFQNRPFINLSNKYTWFINNNAEFNQTLTTNIDKVTTHVDLTTAITTKIIENLALELSFNLSYDTKIPALSKNQKKLDTASKVTIVYSF